MEMIELQLQFVVVTFLGGMGIMFCYSVLRLFRFLFPHKKIVVCMEDYLFWILASVPCFLVFFWGNDGSLRWYGVMAMFLGGIMFERVIYQRMIWKLGMRFVKFHKKLKKNKKKDCNMEKNSI